MVVALTRGVSISDPKTSGHNELFQETGNKNNNYHYYYDAFPEPDERDSIASSFDAVASIVRQYKNELTAGDELNSVPNEIGVPDTVNVGDDSDTYLTDVTVKGLKKVDSRNVTMSWAEDLVSGWPGDRVGSRR